MQNKLFKTTTFLASMLIILSLTAEMTANAQYSLNGKTVTKQEYEAGMMSQQARQLEQQGKTNEALAMHKKAVELGPNLAGTHINYALILCNLHRNEEATREFEQACKLSPDLSMAWFNLAAQYKETGQVAKAISTYEEAIKRFPRDPNAAMAKQQIGFLKQANAYSGGGAENTSNDYMAAMNRAGLRRWPRQAMPITVFISNGQGVQGFQPKYMDLLAQCLNDWSQASQGRVQFQFVNNPNQARMACWWVDNPSKLHSQGEAGEAQVNFDQQGNIVHANVAILTMEASKQPISINRLRRTCLHELGHALGFSAHSLNPEDIMFYSEVDTDKWANLSKRDLNSICKLYSN